MIWLWFQVLTLDYSSSLYEKYCLDFLLFLPFCIWLLKEVVEILCQGFVGVTQRSRQVDSQIRATLLLRTNVCEKLVFIQKGVLCTFFYSVIKTVTRLWPEIFLFYVFWYFLIVS